MAADRNPETKLSHTAAMILQALDAGFVYGFSIMEMTGLPSGTVYPAMRRLERGELIRSQWEKQSIADAEQRPPRKYYKLTAAGQDDARVIAEALSAARAADSDGGGEANMKSPLEAGVWAFNVGILRSASLFVPAGQRTEWCSEWRGELWQVRSQSSSDFSWTQEREITRFCMGAFNDAFCLRRIDRHVSPSQTARTRSLPLRICSVESAWQCLLFLVFLLGLSFALSRMLPGVRAERSLIKAPFRSGLVLIENVENEDSPRTISSGQYQLWKQSKQEFFDGFAFYRVTKELVNLGPSNTRWGVASTSSNFFSLMGLPIRFRQTDASVGNDLPSVILSEDIWKREFGADPHVAGGVVRVGLRNATIAGVAPAEPWHLPGKVDAWLVEPDSQSVVKGSGYVIAHLSSSGRLRMSEQRVPITSYAPHRSPDDLLGIKLSSNTPGPRGAFFLQSYWRFSHYRL